MNNYQLTKGTFICLLINFKIILNYNGFLNYNIKCVFFFQVKCLKITCTFMNVFDFFLNT